MYTIKFKFGAHLTKNIDGLGHDNLSLYYRNAFSETGTVWSSTTDHKSNFVDFLLLVLRDYYFIMSSRMDGFCLGDKETMNKFLTKPQKDSLFSKLYINLSEFLKRKFVINPDDFHVSRAYEVSMDFEVYGDDIDTKNFNVTEIENNL